METERFRCNVESQSTGMRLDKFLAQALAKDYSRMAVKRALESGDVSKEGAPEESLSPKTAVCEGETYICVMRGTAPHTDFTTEKDLPLSVIFEDEYLAVIDKPAGMTVHPGAGTGDDTLVHALYARYGTGLPEGSGADRPGVVHRLDRDTSGLMAVAKTDKAHMKLSRMIADREVTRIYHAVCRGRPFPSAGVVDVPIGRHPTKRTLMAPKDTGKQALTHYRMVENYAQGAASLIECRLETGRTHQIRVHMQHRQCPLIGDKSYGTARGSIRQKLPEEARDICRDFARQALHAVRLSFAHPFTGENMTFTASYPEDMEKLLAALAKKPKT